MQLTFYTDYSLRVLIYLASVSERRCTVQEIASAYDISRHHLVKVVRHLGDLGYVKSTRGKHGGLQLAMPAHEINLGEVIRQTEPHLNLMECMDEETNRCIISSQCALKSLLHQALQAFLAVLDRYSLADIVRNREALVSLFPRQKVP